MARTRGATANASLKQASCVSENVPFVRDIVRFPFFGGSLEPIPAWAALSPAASISYLACLGIARWSQAGREAQTLSFEHALQVCP